MNITKQSIGIRRMTRDYGNINRFFVVFDGSFVCFLTQ